MKTKVNIGIIGHGVVGSAISFGFSAATGYDAIIRVYDKDPMKSLDSLDSTVNESDFIFVSVPTPSNLDGSIHLNILDQALSDINEVYNSSSTIVLIKSTIVPGTTRKFQEKYSALQMVFNPEFLTERSAYHDFLTQTRFILGGEKENTKKAAELFRDRFGTSVPIIETNFETAELIKYMNNCFFSVKVLMLNEMYLLAEKSGADWDTAIEGFVRDGRVGHSHTNVPGPDGRYGMGGSCLCKDLQAIIKYGDSVGVDMNVLKGAWKTNLKVRPEKDWEQLINQDVIDKNK